MHLLVLPVSGNYFPYQLGLLCELIQAGYDPDVFLGSSGGILCGLLALGGNWTTIGITRLVKKLHCSMFLRSWWPRPLQFLPSWLVGFFRGSLYREGVATQEFFETYFSSSSLTSKEFWIGTSNQTQNAPEFFCNRKAADSRVDPKKLDASWYGCRPLRFLDGNREEIRKAVLASASIPTFVPEQIIGSDSYADGGIYYASPLTPMKECWNALQDEHGLHLTYVNTYDIEDPSSLTCSVEWNEGLFRTGALTMTKMVQSLLVQDRLNGLHLISSDLKHLPRVCLRGNPTILKQIQQFRSTCTRSFLELYVDIHDASFSLTEFTSEDILSRMKTTGTQYFCRFWWVGPEGPGNPPFTLSI